MDSHPERKIKLQVEFVVLDLKLAGNVKLRECTRNIRNKYIDWENKERARLMRTPNAQPEMMPISPDEYCFYPMHLWAFLDSDFKNKLTEHRIIDNELYQELKQSVVSKQPKPEFKFTLSGILPDNYIKIDSKLCFSLYVTVIGDNDILCLQDYGVGYLDIADLIRQKDVKDDITVALRMHTTDNNTCSARLRITHPVITTSTLSEDGSVKNTPVPVRSGVMARYGHILPEAPSLSGPIRSGLDWTPKEDENQFLRANKSSFFQPDGLCVGPTCNVVGDPIHAVPKENGNKIKIINTESMLEREPYPRTRNISQNQEMAQTAIEEYCQNQLKFQKSVMTEIVKGGEDISCPVDPSEETFGGGGMNVPLVGYVMNEPLETIPRYWIRSLDVYAHRYLTRYYPSLMTTLLESETMRAGDGCSDDYANDVGLLFCDKINNIGNTNTRIWTLCSIGVGLMSQYAQMLDYNADYTYDRLTRKKLIVESFGNAIPNHAADCEDSSHCNYCFFEAFTSAKTESDLKDISGISSNDRIGPFIKLLLQIQALLRQYVPFLIIEGVTAAKVQDNSTNKQDAAKALPQTLETVTISGAHASVKLIPYPFLLACLSRSPEVVKSSMGPLLEHVKTTMDNEINKNMDMLCSIYSNYVIDYHKTKKYILPILIGEGTGILEGGILGEPNLRSKQDRAFVYDWPFENASKMPIILDDRTQSPFYKTLVFGITHRFMDALNIGTFHFATKRKNTLFYRSCLYSDFISMGDTVTIIPNLSMESKTQHKEHRLSEKEFSDDMVDIIKSVIKTRLPNPRIKGYSSYPLINIMFIDEPDSEEIVSAQQFVKAIRSDVDMRNRIKIKKTGKVQDLSDATSIISVYFTKDTLGADVLQKIFNYCKTYKSIQNTVIGNVVIYLEYYDENFFSYRLDFYCFGLSV